jgi:hypothetical protein
MRTKIIYITVFIWSFASIVKAQLPDWAQSGTHKKYPAEMYWTAVGFASGPNALEKAQGKARFGVASQIKVTVKGKVDYVQTETIIGNEGIIASEFKSAVESVVDEIDLIGLEFPESYINPVDKSVYVFAAIEKQQYITGLKGIIDEEVKKLGIKIQTAKDLVNAGDLGPAINNYLEAMNIAQPLYSRIILYNSLAIKPYELNKDYIYENIDAELTKLLSRVFLRIVSGNNQQGEIGKALPKPLVLQAFVGDPMKAIPLKGLTITFKAGKNVLEKITTDVDGRATLRYIVAAEGIRAGVGEITAFIDLGRINPKLKQQVEKNTTVVFNFNVEASKKIYAKFEVTGEGSSSSKLNLQKKLAKELEKNNVVINQTSGDYLVRAVINSTDGQSVTGMSGEMKVKNVELAIIIIEIESNNVIATINSSAKGVDKDGNKALEKGIAALKIPTKELNEAIGKLR